MAKKKGPAPPEGGTVDLRALTESMRQRRLYDGRLRLEQQRAEAEQQQARALRDIADALARGAQLPAPAAGGGEGGGGKPGDWTRPLTLKTIAGIVNCSPVMRSVQPAIERLGGEIERTHDGAGARQSFTVRYDLMPSGVASRLAKA